MSMIAIDGSKVKANASKHTAMSHDLMLMEEKKLRSDPQATQAARGQDDIDDQTFGADFRGDELPPRRSHGLAHDVGTDLDHAIDAAHREWILRRTPENRGVPREQP